MPAPTRDKTRLETTTSLKVSGGSSAEAAEAAAVATLVANDPQTPPELRAQAGYCAQELAAPPTAMDASRRVRLLSEWQALVNRNI